MAAWQKSLHKQRATPDEARRKAERYCSYQDRCHQEVRRKLYELGLYGEDVDQVMAQLIEGKFLDEERFARSFARGKHRLKAWGRERIVRQLRQRQISDYCISAGLSEIDEQSYEAALASLLQKYVEQQGQGLDRFTLRGKLMALGYRKGYERELVARVVEGL